MTALTQAPTVEVLIVSYNTRDLLADCLASIEEHKPAPSVAGLTVRVLDNGSSDGSAEVAEQFQGVVVERANENLGFARANNILAASSDADYLMLLNPDTRWREDIVAPLLDVLRSHPRAVAAGPRLEWRDGTRQFSAQNFPTIWYEFAVAIRGTRWQRLVRPFWTVEKTIERVERRNLDLSGPHETPSLWAACWLMRRADIEVFGLFDERYVTYDEDLDFCRRINARGRTFVYEPRVGLTHVGGQSSSETVRRELLRRGRRRYYRTHHGPAAAFVYAKVLPAFSA